MTIECLEKLNSYFVCSDCESGLKIKLVKILKKFITKHEATLLESLFYPIEGHGISMEIVVTFFPGYRQESRTVWKSGFPEHKK